MLFVIKQYFATHLWSDQLKEEKKIGSCRKLRRVAMFLSAIVCIGVENEFPLWKILRSWVSEEKFRFESFLLAVNKLMYKASWKSLIKITFFFSHPDERAFETVLQWYVCCARDETCQRNFFYTKFTNTSGNLLRVQAIIKSQFWLSLCWCVFKRSMELDKNIFL